MKTTLKFITAISLASVLSGCVIAVGGHDEEFNGNEEWQKFSNLTKATLIN